MSFFSFLRVCARLNIIIYTTSGQARFRRFSFTVISTTPINAIDEHDDQISIAQFEWVDWRFDFFLSAGPNRCDESIARFAFLPSQRCSNPNLNSLGFGAPNDTMNNEMQLFGGERNLTMLAACKKCLAT